MYKQCKTERSAARQRELENGLLKLMAIKPYDDITVIDLCEFIQIPRKSFYRYFSSKDGALHALMDHTMMDYEGFNMVYADGDRRTLEKELTQFFLFWLSNRELLDVLAKNKLTGNLVERTINNIANGELVPQRLIPDKAQFVRKQVGMFCVSGLMSIVMYWHREGYPQSAEEMAQVTARLVSEPLFPNLQHLL